MSFFSKIFGGKQSGGKQGTPTPAEAIQKLREVEEMLMKKQEYFEKKVEEELDIIKKNGTKNKRVSLAALKRKKRLDKQLEQIDGTLTTIEYQREALENANTNAEVLKIMNFAAKALKQSHNNMDMDKVEDLMDEIKEQQQIADEIQQVISNPIGFGQEVDEDELLQELEEMDQKELDEALLSTGPVTELPEVPNEEPAKAAAKAGTSKSKVQEEDDDMKELAAWASN
ncbi:charged multivesicular body protein 4b-like protein [Leptotrombidium deliense]|uniref:Charged multivesicular body protein 4b-like protein n=1 Tax=Leptotrombidium deliense TaxID=299467 RepID=A0A443SLE1_9ACAR|nr:charged multivesicular body protein 4b-like protein [Leptotrombidium deliense]